MECECGFDMVDVERMDYDETGAEESSVAIVRLSDELAAVVRNGPDDAMRTRPDAGTWSRHEYACHLRDVLLFQRERVLFARRFSGAEYPNMGREERVDHDGYDDQHPIDAARQLADAARLFGHVLDRLGPEDWDRTVVYGFPVRAERTLRWVAVHTLHECVHHLDDVQRQA